MRRRHRVGLVSGLSSLYRPSATPHSMAGTCDSARQNGTPLTRHLLRWPTMRARSGRIGAAQYGIFMAALILIVDDDPIQRRLLEAMVRRFGYEVEDRRIGRRRAGAAGGAGAPAGRSDHSRSRDARSRRHGRARAHAPARDQDARHRPDRAWLDRSGDLGDARRRARFRRQAGRRRAAAGLDQERAARRCARRRIAPRDAAQRRRTDVPGHRHQSRRTWRASSGSPNAPPNRTFRC